MSARQCECDPKNAHIDRFWIKPYCSGVYSSVVSRPSLRLSPVCCLPRPYPCRERGARAATQRMRWGARRARAPGRTRHSATPGARGPRAWPGHGPRAGCTRGARGVCVLLVSRSSRPSSKILRKTTTKSHRTACDCAMYKVKSAPSGLGLGELWHFPLPRDDSRWESREALAANKLEAAQACLSQAPNMLESRPGKAEKARQRSRRPC